VEFDLVTIVPEPLATLFVQPVRWSIVDDEEYLSSPVVSDQLLDESEERGTVEYLCKSIVEFRRLNIYCAKDMRCLALSVGIDAWLLSNSCPRVMQGPVEPKACFILEEYYAATDTGFFLIAGNRFLSQISCLCASARANRFRGRCTEKPSL
jgi:hypothetical protein